MFLWVYRYIKICYMLTGGPCIGQGLSELVLISLDNNWQWMVLSSGTSKSSSTHTMTIYIKYRKLVCVCGGGGGWQIWYCSLPWVIIWTNWVVFEYPCCMPSFKDICLSIQKKAFTMYGMVAILIMWPGPFEKKCLIIPWRLHMEIGFNGPNGFWVPVEDVWNCWRLSGLGQRFNIWHSYIIMEVPHGIWFQLARRFMGRRLPWRKVIEWPWHWAHTYLHELILLTVYSKFCYIDFNNFWEIYSLILLRLFLYKHVRKATLTLLWKRSRSTQGHFFNKFGSTWVPDFGYQVLSSSTFWFRIRIY